MILRGSGEKEGGQLGNHAPVAFLLPGSSYITGRMKRYLLCSLLAVLIAAFAPGIHAAIAETAMTETEKSDAVKKAEDYLHDLTTVKSRFLQTTQDGTQLFGTFYLSRPGKLRFEYDPPVQDFVVADGIFIYFYDAELGEQSNAPIGQTLADFLLRKDLKLSGDLEVTNVMRGGGLTQISLAQSSDPAAGTLILGFQPNPYALKKWRVIDPTGAVTEVELFEQQAGLKLSDKLFVYRAPAGKKPRYN